MNDTNIDTLNLPGAEAEAEEKKRLDAFNAEYAWRDQTLHGFSSSRKDFWTALCHHAGFPSLYDSLDDLGLFAPAGKAMLFVLSQEAKTLESMRARGMPFAVKAEMMWVDEHVTIPEESEAVDLAARILNASLTSTARPIPTAGREVKN